jgi:drug/metabolite transporter (DMT)-like permease
MSKESLIHLKSMAALVASIAIWGSTFIVVRLLVLESSAPMTITALRFLLAYIFLLPFVRKQGYTPRLSLRPRFILFGLLGVVLPFGFDNIALMFTSAGSASLIYAAFPAVVTLFSVIFLKEKVHGRKLAGILLAIVGVMIISWEGIRDVQGNALLGDALVMGSVVSWASFTILSRKANPHYSPLVITQASFGSSLLLLIPISLAEMLWLGVPRFSGLGILAVIYLGLGASALAFFLWNYALVHIETSVAGVFSNLQPIFGLAFAVFGGEALLLNQAVGGAVAILGVMLCEIGQKRPLAQPAIVETDLLALPFNAEE